MIRRAKVPDRDSQMLAMSKVVFALRAEFETFYDCFNLVFALIGVCHVRSSLSRTGIPACQRSKKIALEGPRFSRDKQKCLSYKKARRTE